jgi:uncharacterized protein YegP (UPF0339 family)
VFYQRYQDVRLEWRWRLVAANHRIIAESGEGYKSKADCDHAIALVKQSQQVPVWDA